MREAMVVLELTLKTRTKLPREEEAVTKGVGGDRDDTEAMTNVSSLSLSLSLYDSGNENGRMRERRRKAKI